MSIRTLFLSLTLLGLGCAHAPPGQPAPASGPLGDPQLYTIFGRVPYDSVASAQLLYYEVEHQRDFLEQVSLVAEDPNAGTPVRYRAVMLLGDRAAAAYIPSLRIAATDRDPRVRAAAAVAAGKIMEKWKGEGRSVVVAALDDPAAEVQAKALEILGMSDVTLLRDFLRRHPKGEVAEVARGLLETAEQRGTPLAADSAGVLRRTGPGGAAVAFQPLTRWPEWDAALGSITVTAPGTTAVRIDSVEVVSNILPLVFSNEGGSIAYEQGRRIFVRELRGGATRELGPGIAPRVQPFTDHFLYLREDLSKRSDLNERTRMRYEVMQASFAGGEPRVLGALGAFAEMRLHGNSSPARWARVVEKDPQHFTLEAEGLETFELPDPFKADSGQ